MGKIGKVKVRHQSAHSRAARRAEPIDINTDKSLKEVSPPTDPTTTANPITPTSSTPTPSILSARPGSGITKRQKAKPLTRAQRLRKEKGMQRAEAVVDQLETKVGKSKDSARNIKDRAGAWEDIDNPVKQEKRVKKKAEKVVGALEKGRKKKSSGKEGVGEEMAMEVDEGVLTKTTAEGKGMSVVMPLEGGMEMDGVDAIT